MLVASSRNKSDFQRPTSRVPGDCPIPKFPLTFVYSMPYLLS
jgi:hypothetical protein